MKKNELIQKINEARTLDINLSSNTVTAVNEISNPHNTIAITGCFQVGKSTLLNKVMFGNDVLLTEGIGLPTTAIPTKIVYGERKKLTVFFKNSNETKVYQENEITEELLRSITTAESEEDRLALANKIKWVELSLPIEKIKNFTFFDTPGVDDPNQDLINHTTAEILPHSDLVVLVVDASRTLSSYSKNFLCKSIFQQGMSRVMVLASYNPQNYKSAENRDAILKAIKSELSQLGRDYVPVYAYTYDNTVDGNILRGTDEIMDCLLKFIEENKEVAKIDKATYYLENDIVSASEKLKAKLEVSGKSEENLQTLKRKIDSAILDLDAEYINVVNDFSSRYGEITMEASEDLDNRLISSDSSALNEFIAKFDDCEDLSETRNSIESAVSEITPFVENILTDISNSVTQRVKELLEDSSTKITSAASRISISSEFTPLVNSGLAGKINPTILKVIELGGVFLGLGAIPAILVLVARNVPVLKNFCTDNIMKNVVLSSIKKSFKDSLESAKLDMLRQFETNSENIKEGIKSAFGEIYEARILPYTSELERNKGEVLSEKEISDIKLVIDNLKKLQEECSI